jgi:hypothetical protein
MRQRRFGRPLIAQQTRESATPSSASDNGSASEHDCYLESLGVITVLMRAFAKDRSFVMCDDAATVARRLARLDEHAAALCPFCMSQETLRNEAEFLDAVIDYLCTPHARTASSLDEIWIEAPGKDEDETVRRFPFKDLVGRLEGKAGTRPKNQGAHHGR